MEDTTENRRRVFFCYSRVDAAFALKLARALRDGGVPIWIDQLDIPAGANWDRAIEEALSTTETTLVLLSPDAVASENVLDEVGFAIDDGDRVVPVMYRDCKIPFRLRRRQWVDMRGAFEPALAELLALLNGRPQKSLTNIDRAINSEHTDRSMAEVASDDGSGPDEAIAASEADPEPAVAVASPDAVGGEPAPSAAGEEPISSGGAQASAAESPGDSSRDAALGNALPGGPSAESRTAGGDGHSTGPQYLSLPSSEVAGWAGRLKGKGAVAGALLASLLAAIASWMGLSGASGASSAQADGASPSLLAVGRTATSADGHESAPEGRSADPARSRAEPTGTAQLSATPELWLLRPGRHLCVVESKSLWCDLTENELGGLDVSGRTDDEDALQGTLARKASGYDFEGSFFDFAAQKKRLLSVGMHPVLDDRDRKWFRLSLESARIGLAVDVQE